MQGEQPAARATNFDGTMLKFLTHKLRTHSLNEDPNQEKADDDHDSGTESDDEFQNGNDVADELSTAMDSLDESSTTARDSAVPSDADLGASPPSATTTPSFSLQQHFNQPSSSSGCSSAETPPIVEPQPQPCYDLLLLSSLAQATDQHSSEEELEVINGPKVVEVEATTTLLATGPVNITSQPLQASSAVQTPVLIRPNAVPEKRKWSEANSGHAIGDGIDGRISRSSCTLIRRHEDAEGTTTAYSAPVSRTGREASGSSDEEVQGLCCSSSRSGSAISQPVQFRSSPPTDAHKPVRSLSPPPKLFHASPLYSSSSPSASTSCLASESSSHHHHHRTHHHHRPRSRPRPLSQYHSHTSLELQQPCSSISQQQQQELADVDVISSCSPRKRHRPPHRLPRPCLDFEKMQQLKAQSVTTWRHTSEHGGKELSVCW